MVLTVTCEIRPDFLRVSVSTRFPKHLGLMDANEPIKLIVKSCSINNQKLFVSIYCGYIEILMS